MKRGVGSGRAGAGLGLVASIALAMGGAGRASAGESAESIYPFSGIDTVVVSPDGHWIAASARRGEDQAVLVQRVGDDEVVGVARAKAIDQLAWEAPDTLIYDALTTSGTWQTGVARLAVKEGSIAVEGQRIFAPGGLVDASPTVPGEVIWAILYEGWTSLYRVSISDLVDFREEARAGLKTIEIGKRLAIVNGPTSNWIVDRHGVPRAALRHDKTGFTLMMPDRGSGPFISIVRWSETKGDRAVPLGLTNEGSRVIVGSYAGKNTIGLHEFDGRSGKVVRPVFVREDLDVSDVLRDPLTGDLVAAAYEVGGERRFHYFEAYRDRFLSKLPEAWRGRPIAVLNGTLDSQVFVFVESSDVDPGTYFVRDRNGEIHPVGRRAENVDRSKLSPMRTFRVKSKDGLAIEAYVTLPRDSSGPSPLVVMPHGGPHGTRDSRRFDPLVQYLSSWGFAVLQMNFRGSEGFGREFENRVRGQWARGIEDDIDAAVEHAMALPEIDESRICIIGMSYGGFSSLASVIRHRDRYRCAVSVAGVTDVPLMTESSDFADEERSLARWKGLFGDPEKDRAKMLEISPAYHADAIDVPVLIVQGTADRRVDPDHAHRMALMLELYDKDVQMIEMEDAGHGFDRDGEIILARSIRRFVTPHLMPDTPFLVDPETDDE